MKYGKDNAIANHIPVLLDIPIEKGMGKHNACVTGGMVLAVPVNANVLSEYILMVQFGIDSFRQKNLQ